MISAQPTESRDIRIASALFFIICVPLSVWETTTQSGIFVAFDPAATARNLLVNEFAFRATILSHFAGTIFFFIMVMLYHKVFSPANKFLGRFIIIPIIAQLAIVFILETMNYTALMILKSDIRENFGLVQQQETGYFLLRLYRYGIGADKIIFGLYFIPLGLLVYQSGFAPRFVSILMIIGGVGYIVDTSLYLLLQRNDYLVVQSIKLYSSASYSIALLWFLVKGVRNPKIELAQS